MPTPESVEREHTLLTAASRYDDLRGRDALASTVGAEPGEAAPGLPPLDREEALEMLALGEVLARKAGYGLPDYLGGHGVGTAMHEDPPVPNTGRPGRGLVLDPGLVIAIEPMLIEGGGHRFRTLRDGWTLVTWDRSRAAHAEHTIVVTADGPEILTVSR